MKIFAVMLLMLCSFSFLKAQTMVVETADSVESFEVGEIKSLIAFSRNSFVIWLNIEHLPIQKLFSFKYSGSAEETQEENYLYKTFQVVECKSISNNHFNTRSGSMRFTFYSNITESGSGTMYEGNVIFDENTNLIKSLYIKASGSGGSGNMPNPKYVFGNFEIELENLPFTFTPTGYGKSIIKGKDIEKVIKRLMHKEEYSEKYLNSQTEFLKILDSQIDDSSIITIDLLY